MVDETSESEWGTVAQGGFRTGDDDLPDRMTEEEAMSVGDSGSVEKVVLRQADGCDEWTAMYDGVEVSEASRVGALEALAAELREREE